jgi:hypothetical protein
MVMLAFRLWGNAGELSAGGAVTSAEAVRDWFPINGQDLGVCKGVSEADEIPK